MIQFGVIRKGVYDWVKASSDGLPTVWLEQGEGRPQKPYIGLKLINPSIAIGQDEIRRDEKGRAVVSGIRELVVSINVYGHDSEQTATDIQSSVEMPGIQERLRRAGLAYVMKSEVRDLSTLMDTNYETRHQLDVRFRASVNAVDILGVPGGVIESVDVIGLGEEQMIETEP